jgi:cytoskeletal protein RodZ
VSIGDTLAEARRRAGLTLTEVSRQTRIRESIIRSIETDDFSPCGGDFYARGHIRSIAEVVGVDPVPLIREYDAEHGKPGSMRASQIFEPATPIKIRDPRQLHLGRVLAVALLAVVGFGVYHLVSTSGSHPAANATATVRPAVTITAQPKNTVRPSSTTAPAYAKGTAVIKVTATSACWIGLTPNGRVQQPYDLQAGDSRTWNVKRPVTLVVGNPSGINLSVNGRVQRMNPAQVATLSINPASTPMVTIG